MKLNLLGSQNFMYMVTFPMRIGLGNLFWLKYLVWQKIFFLDLTLFGINIVLPTLFFLDPRFFLTLNCCQLKIFMDPKFFLGPKFLGTQNCFSPHFLGAFFLTQYFLRQIFSCDRQLKKWRCHFACLRACPLIFSTCQLCTFCTFAPLHLGTVVVVVGGGCWGVVLVGGWWWVLVGGV